VNAQTCVGTYGNRYICTNNAAKAHAYNRKRQSQSKRVIDLGIEQIIVGSDEEIHGIKEVIMKMDEYVLNEVLAKPEYARVRGNW
jgi:hypothetical protein